MERSHAFMDLPIKEPPMVPETGVKRDIILLKYLKRGDQKKSILFFMCPKFGSTKKNEIFLC